MPASSTTDFRGKKIILRATRHRGVEVVSLVFDKDAQLIERVKTLPGVAWSQSRKFWYIEAAKFRLNMVFEAFRGLAWLDYSALRTTKGDDVAPSETWKAPLPELSAGSAADLKKFDSWLRHRRYIASTIKTYTAALQSFLRWLGDRPADAVGSDDVVAYVNEYVITKRLSFS